MNKYFKYVWLMFLVIVPVFLNISKTEQDIFTIVGSSQLDGVREEIIKKPALLKSTDKFGFTLYDYAGLNQDTSVQGWLLSQQVHSGVSKTMVERIRLWFLLLGVPVNSKNFHLQGVYDKGLEEAILSYQTTRGLPKSGHITPDWYADLEEEGIFHLQSLLFDEGSNSITGHWNDESKVALELFQKEYQLPQTGHLSIADIVKLKKVYANSATGKVVNEEVATNDDGSSENMKQPAVQDEPPKAPKTESKGEQESDNAPKLDDDQKNEELTAGILIDGNATPGKLLNLQVWLTLAGFPAGTLDGQMGPATRQAIQDFEKSIGLKPTGYMSTKWEVPLEKIIWKKVQEKLKQLELYDQDVDGLAGAGTYNALKAYEESSGLEPKGVLLPETLSMLFNEGQMTDDGSMDDIPQTDIDHTEEDGIIEEEGEIDSEGETPSPKEKTDEIPVGLAGFNPKGTEEGLKLQLMLTILGDFKSEINGEMNQSLTDAVKKFQERSKLGVDGKAGRQTLAELDKQVIARLQVYFKEKKLMDDAPTGTLGPKTRRIIIDLMKQNKLPERDPTQLNIGILLIVLGDVNGENYVQTYLDILEQRRILKEKTEKAQEYLVALGYFSGKIDGILGKTTKEAIAKFQKDHRFKEDTEINEELFKQFDSKIIKNIQEALIQLGYKIKADGIMGKGTKGTIETFQKRYSYKVTGEPSLETLHQINGRIAESNRRAPALSSNANVARTSPDTTTRTATGGDRPVRGVMPTMGAKGAQAERILTEPPKAIVGRITMIHNSKGELSGCKVNNISISATICGGARNNQQCRIVYRKGRVLSVSCRG